MYVRSRDTRYRLTGIPSHSAPGAAERACERVGLFLALSALRGWAPPTRKVRRVRRVHGDEMSRHKYANPDHCVHAIDHIKKLPDADERLLEELARVCEAHLAGTRVVGECSNCTRSAAAASGGKNLRRRRLLLRRRGQGHFAACPSPRTPGHGPSADEWGAHMLRDFDHCMKILIHELSHIVHGNHSAHSTAS